MPARAWPRKRAEADLKRLVRKHKIRVHWLKGRDWHDRSEAYVAARLVFIPHPNNPRQLLVALHEIGHIVGELTMEQRTDHDFSPGTWWLLMEAAAWAWAAEHIPDHLADLIDPLDYEHTVGKGMWTHAWDVAARAEGR